jgi:hypothetical protein
LQIRVILIQVSLVAFWGKLKELKELARYARFGKLKDDSYCNWIACLKAYRIPKSIVL